MLCPYFAQDDAFGVNLPQVKIRIGRYTETAEAILITNAFLRVLCDLGGKKVFNESIKI